MCEQDTIATDVIYPNTVCRARANNTDESLSINRAGAVAEYIGPSRKGGDGAVVLCGGRNNDGQVKDTCLAYTPKTKVRMHDRGEISATIIIERKQNKTQNVPVVCCKLQPFKEEESTCMLYKETKERDTCTFGTF